MSQISLITPPDRLYTNEYSFLLIYPSQITKEHFQAFLAEIDIPLHVYLYEQKDVKDPEWLLDVFLSVDTVIIDIDNCQPPVRDLASYFLSKDKTYWLTKGEDRLYNIISKNRIYDLDFLKHKLGDTLGEK